MSFHGMIAHFCLLLFSCSGSDSVMPWTIAPQASLSLTVSRSLLKFMSIELVISSLASPFFFHLKSFPASGSFPMSQHFTSGGPSIEASRTELPMRIQHWFPLGLTALISLLFKGLSRVFTSTTVQNHQLYGIQPSLWSNSHIHTWLL